MRNASSATPLISPPGERDVAFPGAVTAPQWLAAIQGNIRGELNPLRESW
jgi:hypothetical protein